MSMAEQQSPSIAPLEDFQRDLGALRNDVSRLTQEVTNYLNASGRKAVRDANERLDAAVRQRPLAAVGIAMGLGFVFGTIYWRRR
jgi:ElaB/YqjD/DUF883 family membrane-anchored ribosome-binding protein